MSWNAYKRLLALLPETPADVGTVTAVTANGCEVELLDGSTVSVRGVGEIGDHVYLKDGAIEGPAPVLATVEIEV